MEGGDLDAVLFIPLGVFRWDLGFWNVLVGEVQFSGDDEVEEMIGSVYGGFERNVRAYIMGWWIHKTSGLKFTHLICEHESCTG